MTRKLMTASGQLASFATRQPRVAVGVSGLGGILFLELVGMLLAGHLI